MDIRKYTKNRLSKELLKIAGKESDMQILCIGSDQIMGDCLGPLVGHILTKEYAFPFPVYGTLKSPVNALNLPMVWEGIKNNYTIAIDAAVTSETAKKRIGIIKIEPGSLKPGTALKRELPAVGSISIKGLVSHQHEPLTTVNLGLVMTMAEYVASEIITFAQKHHVMQIKEAAATQELPLRNLI